MDEEVGKSSDSPPTATTPAMKWTISSTYDIYICDAHLRFRGPPPRGLGRRRHEHTPLAGRSSGRMGGGRGRAADLHRRGSQRVGPSCALRRQAIGDYAKLELPPLCTHNHASAIRRARSSSFSSAPQSMGPPHCRIRYRPRSGARHGEQRGRGEEGT